MSFRYIEPEVSGGFGSQTEFDNSDHPPIIRKLHYEFDGWLGNDIIESFPCYLVTERLRKGIENLNLTGISFSSLIITTSDIFKDIYPDLVLPSFYWAKIKGVAEKDDFGLAKDYRLVISSRVVDLLKQFNVDQSDFEDFY